MNFQDELVAEYTCRYGEPPPSQDELRDRPQAERALVDGRFNAISWELDWKPSIDALQQGCGFTLQEALLYDMVRRINVISLRLEQIASWVYCIDNMMHQKADGEGEDWKRHG